MNELLLLIFSLSVSGSILALVLFALKPLVKNRLSQRWQYYIWLIVILRFLLPFTPAFSITGEAVRLVRNIPALITAERTGTALGEMETGQQAILQPPPVDIQAIVINYWAEVLSYAWLLWLVIALTLFTYRVVSYRNFVRFVKGMSQTVTDTRVLDIYNSELEKAKIKDLPLRVNNWVPSPMLAGIFRPVLIIPAIEGADKELHHAFRHELVHYKRFDFLYKWLVQLTKCLHWFNPLVYAISAQIDKACELSCDEEIIKQMEEAQRKSYGDSLVSFVKYPANLSSFIVSMTMSEEGETIKERLDSIIKYREKTRVAAAAAVFLSIILFTGAALTGAYSPSLAHNVIVNNTTESNIEILFTNLILVADNVPNSERFIGMPPGDLNNGGWYVINRLNTFKTINKNYFAHSTVRLSIKGISIDGKVFAIDPDTGAGIETAKESIPISNRYQFDIVAGDLQKLGRHENIHANTRNIPFDGIPNLAGINEFIVIVDESKLYEVIDGEIALKDNWWECFSFVVR